jgi:hypothetical protein
MTQATATSEVETSRGGGTQWALLFALVVCGWLTFFFLHPALLTKVGVGHFRNEVAPARFQEMWFLDTLAILAANDAVAAGANPYVANPLDYFNRPHSYGPAWLHLRHLGLTRFHTPIVGLALVTAFLASVLLFLRPTSPRALLWCTAIVCTTPVLAAIERANNDLVVFLILMPVVPSLLSGPQWVRWLALPLIVLAAALKYYPATAGLLFLASAGGPREMRWRLFAAVIALTLVGWHILVSVPAYGLFPEPAGVLSFGATGIFRAWGITGMGPRVIAAGIALGALCVWWRSPILRDWRSGSSTRREWLYFILGSVLLSGCFWLSQNFAYRWVLGIWMVPFLWRLSRGLNAPPAAVKLARVTSWLLIVLLWGEAVPLFVLSHWMPERLMPALDWIFLGMQPFTWAFFLCLVGFLTKFIRDNVGNLLATPR